MLEMIVPLLIGLVGYMMIGIGKSTGAKLFTIGGTVMTTISGLWFLYIAFYNIGYMLA